MDRKSVAPGSEVQLSVRQNAGRKSGEQVRRYFAEQNPGGELVRAEDVAEAAFLLMAAERDEERNLLYIRGAIPGPRGALVVIRTAAKGA